MRSFSKNCYEYTLVYTETMVFQDRILQRVAGGGWPVTGDLHINILTRTIFPKKKLRIVPHAIQEQGKWQVSGNLIHNSK